MTTRRSFLKRLAVTAAGFAVSANILTDKATAKPPVVNLAINAPYKIEFLFGKNAFMRIPGLPPTINHLRVEYNFGPEPDYDQIWQREYEEANPG